jgi:hypothetical protein
MKGGNSNRFQDCSKGYKKMADGGPAKKKMKPHVPAKVEDPIAKSKHKLKRVENPKKKMANGGMAGRAPAPTGGGGATTQPVQRPASTGMAGMAGRAAQQAGAQRAAQGAKRAMGGPPARANPQTSRGASGGPARRRFADGGAVHGSPTSTPKPGGTTRKRPKPGDKNPNFKPPSKPSKPPMSSKPKVPQAKPGKPSYPHRDYRGTKGAIDDAEGVKKK